MSDAANEGDVHAVAAWLDEGGCVNARSCSSTLLMAAADGGQEAVVRMLLQRGASVNLQDSLFGCTALMDAAGNGHTTTVKALLDAKADASLQNFNGLTALMLAEHQKHTVTAQLLRQHAEREAFEGEARAAASATRAAAAADATAAESRLGEEAEEREEAEKEPAANRSNGKKKKTKAALSAAAAGSAAAVMDKALIEAAAIGDAHAVAAWLHKGGGVDARCAERDGATLLMVAATGAQEAVVRMLL